MIFCSVKCHIVQPFHLLCFLIGKDKWTTGDKYFCHLAASISSSSRTHGFCLSKIDCLSINMHIYGIFSSRTQIIHIYIKIHHLNYLEWHISNVNNNYSVKWNSRQLFMFTFIKYSNLLWGFCVIFIIENRFIGFFTFQIVYNYTFIIIKNIHFLFFYITFLSSHN